MYSNAFAPAMLMLNSLTADGFRQFSKSLSIPFVERE